MKAKFITLVCILAALLTFTTANAASVDTFQGAGLYYATGIQSLDIGGTLYDVAFNTSYLGPFSEVFANAAIDAIVDAFNSNGNHISYVSNGQQMSDNGFLVPFANVFGAPVAAGVSWDDINNGEWHKTGAKAGWYNLYANFTPTAVPIPGAALLFGSSLVLIGFIRKRFNR